MVSAATELLPHRRPWNVRSAEVTPVAGSQPTSRSPDAAWTGGRLAGGESRDGFSPAKQGSGACWRAAPLVAGADDGSLVFWDAATGRLRERIPAHRGAVDGLACSPSGGPLYTAGADGKVRSWNPVTRRPGTLLGSPRGVPGWLLLSQDGRTLVGVSKEGDVAASPVGAGGNARRFRLAPRKVNGAAFSPDGRFLATTHWERGARFWEIASGKQVASFQSGDDPEMSAPAFSRDGRLLLIGGVGGAIRLWDVTSRRPVGRIPGQKGGVGRIAFHPDGETLASVAYQDRYVRLWRLSERRQVGVLPGTDLVENTELAFSSDGRGWPSGAAAGGSGSGMPRPSRSPTATRTPRAAGATDRPAMQAEPPRAPASSATCATPHDLP